MNSKLCCALLALLSLGSSAVFADGERLTREQLRATELSNKGVGNTPPVQAPAATVMYSATTVGGPTWTRPFANCTGASGLGPFRLHQQSFNVTVTGAYTLSSVQTGFDGYIFVYQNAFNAATPLVNCVLGNDDGAGIGSSTLTTNLTAGTTYIYVTTGFDGSVPDEGPFTNTITGPGDINLVGALPAANLGVVKTAPNGIVTGGQFVYRLVASNAGPAASSAVTVSDTLPTGLTFVSSDCGATNAGNAVTWTLATLANGASSTCNLTVNQASSTCTTLTNTATIASVATTDGNSANNSSTISNGGQLVADPSFENNPSGWVGTSTNFGSPLCTVADCGNGGGSAGPRTGLTWVWFGGAGADLEVGSVQQTVTVPVGANTLTFGYRLGTCAVGAGAGDFVRALVGGTEVWRRNASATECGAATYSTATVDISAFATGASRVVRFESTTGSVALTSNFSIDDISIAQPPICIAAATFNLNVTALNFGNVITGTSSGPRFITISNTGVGAGMVQAPTLTGSFGLSGGTCPAAPFSLAGGANCTFGVVYNAGSIGGSTGSFNVTAGTQQFSVALAGASVLPAPAFIPTNSTWFLGALIALMTLLAGVFVYRRQI